MDLIKNIKNNFQYLSAFQKEFLLKTDYTFSIIPPKNIGASSFVKYEPGNKMVEISLVHEEESTMQLLFLIHQDIIEIGCLDFIYFLNIENDVMFKSLPNNEKWQNLNELINNFLEANFELIVYSYKGKLLRSKIIWDNFDFLNQQKTYVFFEFLYKRSALKIEVKKLKSFFI